MAALGKMRLGLPVVGGSFKACLEFPGTKDMMGKCGQISISRTVYPYP